MHNETTVVEVDLAGLENLLKTSKKPILLDVWAAWCAPCRALAPILAQIAATTPSLTVAKLDAEANKGLEVRGLPTLILFKHGHEAARRTGLQTRDQLLSWLAGNGVTLSADVERDNSVEPPPLGGAFYGDKELRDFLLQRWIATAESGALKVSRFPYWTEGTGTVSAALVRSGEHRVFERVTGLPAALAACLEVAKIGTAQDMRSVADLMPAGADLRAVPAALANRWLDDDAWGWPDVLGPVADELRRDWLKAARQEMASRDVETSSWDDLRARAAQLVSEEPLDSVQDHFGGLMRTLSPLPPSSEAQPWGSALLLFGTYLVFVKAQYEDGWRAQDFAMEGILMRWMKAHAPAQPEAFTGEVRAQLENQYAAEHAVVLAEHEPKKRRFNANAVALMAPWEARLRGHLLDAMRGPT